MPHLRLRFPRLKLPDRNNLILIASLGFCISFIGILVFFKYGHKAAAGWYDDNYLYRQAFTFTHNAAITSDRAVTFTLNTSTLISGGVMQSDCDDVRFTDENGKPLKFQMTGSCNSATTTFEVVFPSVTATGNAAYVYYGNASASSASQSVSGITTLTPATSGDPSISSRTAEEAGPAPVAAWTFDDATGTTAQDSSSTNYDGTLTNGPTWKQESECVSGTCLSFDGTNDYVDAGTGTVTDLGTADVTISAWIRAQDPILTYGNIILNGATTNTDQGFFWSVNGSTGVLEVWVSNGTTYVVNDFAGTTDLRDNKWHYVTWVWDRDVGNKFYIDGRLEKSDSSTNASSITSGQNLTIGGRSVASSPFKGLIDELKIYEYVRSETQIQEDYVARSSVHGASTQFGNPDEGRKLMDGLIGWWKLDESASPALDSSGVGTTGVWNNNTAAASAKFGNGATFDGTDDDIQLIDSDLYSVTTTNQLSVSAWVKFNLVTARQEIVSKGASSNYEWDLRINSDSKLYASLFNSSASTDILAASGTTSLSTGTWYHVTMTIDYANPKITLYLNGQKEAESTTLGGSYANGTAKVRIGGRDDGLNDLKGSVDEVRIYNKFLSPADVQILYAYAPSPVGYWKLDENVGGDGTTINDSSTYGNSGTLTSPSGGTVFGSTPTFQQVVSGTALGSPVSVSTTSITGVTDNLYIAAIQGKGGDGVISSVTGLGLTWNYVDAANPVQCGRGNASDLAVYYAIGTPSGNGAVTANFSNPPSDQAAIVVTRYSGVDTSDPIGAVTSANGVGVEDTTCGTVTDDDTPTVDITTTGTNSLVYGAIGKRSRSFTPGTGYTERADVSSSTDGGTAAGVAVEDKSQASPGTVTVDGTLSSTSSWSIYAVEIKSASTTTGAGTTWVPGKYGSALQFDGSSGYISRADDSDFDFTTSDSFTIEGWFKHPVKSSGTDVILAKYKSTTGTDGGYKLLMESDGDLTCGVDTDNSSFPLDSATSTAATYDDNTWHHVSCVKNGTTGLYIYIDGALVASDTSLTSSGTYANTDSLYMGIDGDGVSNGWKGQLDDIKIYNYARNTGQIVEDINAGHPLGGSPVGSPAAYYKFDEGYGSTAYDSSSFLNNATLGSGASAPTWTNSGKFAKALSFDGTNDYVSFSRGTNIQNIASQGTISTWVYYNILDSTLRTAVDIANTGNSGLILFSNNGSNRPRLQYGTGAATTTVDASSTFTTGAWYNIIATWDATGSKIYVNGNLEGSSTVVPSITISSGTAYIGSNQNNLRFHAGKIDEVKLYSAAMNADQVRVEYNRGKAAVFGSSSTASDGKTADNSAARRYCLPGDTATCNAPVGEWLLDENSGTTMHDTSGNNNNGTITGTMRQAHPCPQGSCLTTTNASGVADIVSIPDPASGVLDFNSSQSFTTEVWVKSATDENTAYVPLWKGGASTSDPGYDTEIDSSSDSLARCHYSGGGFSDTAKGTTTIANDNKWHQITCVMDRSGIISGTAGLFIFVDGKLEGSDLTLTGVGGTNSNALQIGEGVDNTYEYGGAVDAIRIYDYARTPAQIAWDYNKGAPVAQYKFDECQGTTAYNSARTSNNTAAGMNGTITIASGGTNTSAGTCSGTSSQAWKNGATGKINSSINLDGSNDYVSITDNDALEFSASQNFSVATWVKIPASQAVAGNGEGSIIDKGNTTNIPYRIRYVFADGTFYASRDDGGTHQPACGNSTSIGDNTWHHIVFAKVGSTLSCYLDGKVVDSTTDTTTGTTTSAENIYIGQKGDGTRYLTASIDDVRIYNYGLSPVQVRNVYNNGSVSFK